MMASYDIMSNYEDDLFQDKNENITDLQSYYMTQFNLELENGTKKSKSDTFKYGVEESFDFEVLHDWPITNNATDFEAIDKVIDSDINEDNIKEVLLDLDSIEFEEKDLKAESYENANLEKESYQNNDYIDDESLIDELCREDGETCRLTPDNYNEEFFSSTCVEKQNLPSIETAFARKYCNYNNNEGISQSFCNETILPTNEVMVENLDHYSYPNNFLYNLENDKKYILPDTPTSCTEYNYDKTGRKISTSESVESDVQSSSYYDENSETFDDDELFINLDDFGLAFENDNGEYTTKKSRQNEKYVDKEKSQGEKICLWEQCFEKHPNQTSLVEHIERTHVNSYKGDEFSCLWKDCARARRPFNARYKLLIHMRVHSGHKPNRCHHPGCGKAFSRLENLKIHIRSHTGERPYTCPAPHCRKAFSNSSDRAKHQRTHFNARPYACGAVGCGKRYTDPSSLRKHVKSHPHIANAPRACLAPRVPRRIEHERTVPTSPAKLATLRCIRNKLTVPRLNLEGHY